MTKVVRVSAIKGRIDFAVMTIREDEFEAVLSRLKHRQPVVDGKQFYEYSQVGAQADRRIAVAVVRAYEQGQSVAQQIARDLIDDLNPRWLILAGIAGGIPDTEFSLGDVLIASRIIDLSVTAALEDKPTEFRPAGGPVHPQVERLLGALPAWRERFGAWNSVPQIPAKPQIIVPVSIDDDHLYGSAAAKEGVRKSLLANFPNPGNCRPPLFRIGAVASSNVLLKDTSLLDEWRRSARHLSHIEMEAGGVYLAARHSGALGNEEVPLLCVRGISDIVGFKRSPEWTQYACDVAASFLFAMITTLPREMFHARKASAWSRLRERLPPAAARFLAACKATFVDASAQLATLLKRRISPTPTVNDIINACKKSSKPLLDLVVPESDRLPRTELQKLEESVAAGTSSVYCLLGLPGSGKTALLALIAERAIALNIVTLGIKADLLPSRVTFDTWSRQELGMNITALDAVRVAASQSRVLVLIDQMDALASTVDLTSDRLNTLIDFVRQCSVIPNVSVICSCRNFDYYHDARFALLGATEIPLDLPEWTDVAIQLKRHGVPDPDMWPEPFKESLRTPQYLKVYVERFAATRNADPFGSYLSMLDDLWARELSDEAEREFLYRLTTYLIDDESLWAPAVLFEGDQKRIKSLAGKGILLEQDGKIGFRHQTLLEHAKARLFTKEGISLCEFVVSRQDAIFVRPTLWAVLKYLRDTGSGKYRVELESLIGQPLRLHLRYLLIEFLGQVQKPEDFEQVVMVDRLANEEDRLRVLISIRANAGWFTAFRAAQFPTVMSGAADRQWPMIGVISDAWEFARDDCLDLISTYWLGDREKDRLTWRVMGELRKWDSRAVEMVCTLIRRAEVNEERLFWAESLVTAISDDKPELAPRVFVETMSRIVSGDASSTSDDHHHGRSPLEANKGWYDLTTVAERAPVEFIRQGWNWLVHTCTRFHAGYESTVVNHYAGSCYALDEDREGGRDPILAAYSTAIDISARESPEVFVDITKESWDSTNAVVHRLLIRGLCFVVHKNPDIGLEYLKGDPRRLAVGSYESNEQSDSTELIAAMVPNLSPEKRNELEKLIWSWPMYRDGVELEEDQLIWQREARVRLLASIPEKFLSAETIDNLRKEKSDLPDWNEGRSIPHGGSVEHIPPISKLELLGTEDDEILKKIRESQEPEPATRRMIPVNDGWQVAGGPSSAGREVAELAKEHSERATQIIELLIRDNQIEAASAAMSGLSEATVTKDQVIRLANAVGVHGGGSCDLHNEVSRMLYRYSDGGLPDDICDLLEKWLAGFKGSGDLADNESESSRQREEDRSILWGYHGGLVSTDRSFWPLVALTEGYLRRTPPECSLWLTAVEAHSQRGASVNTWSAYASLLRRIRNPKCDKQRGALIVEGLFSRITTLRSRIEGIRLLANVADVLRRSFLEAILNDAKSSSNLFERQAYGELITLIAFRDKEHGWARDMLEHELGSIETTAIENEAIAIGIAFAAGHLWDQPEVRSNATEVLCRIIPHANGKIAQALATVFWAREDFPADQDTDQLLTVLAENDSVFSQMAVADLAEHLASLLPHKRSLVLGVCNAILRTRSHDNDLFEAGPYLVKISLTLQRFADTRSTGLSLLEQLLKLGLDDAYRALNDIDVRPAKATARQPRTRRRRKPKNTTA